MHDTSDSPITLRRVRGFHVGGARRRVDGFAVETRARVPGDAPVTVDMNGDHMVGQLYATHYQQARRAYALPVLLWHGGGLTGACWDETPDGRPGWLEYFLRAGCDVVVSDAFERGRASFPACPQVLPNPPEHRSLDAVWHHFRLGAEGAFPSSTSTLDLRRAAYAGSEFPVEAIEQFARQFVARWSGTEEYALQAYAALLREVGPCVVIGASWLSPSRRCTSMLPASTSQAGASCAPIAYRVSPGAKRTAGPLAKRRAVSTCGGVSTGNI